MKVPAYRQLSDRSTRVFARWPLVICWLALLGAGFVARTAAVEAKGSTPWTLLSSRFGAAAVCDGTTLYVIGGSGAPDEALDDVEAIDVASGIARRTNLRVTPRRFFAAVLMGREIFVLGGEKKEGFVAGLEVIDLGKEVVRRANYVKTPRRMANAVAAESRIYTFGGLEAGYHGAAPRTVALEIYNPKSNRWTSGSPMPAPKEASAVLHEGHLYVLGGYNPPGALASCERFDLASGQWEVLSPAPFPMSAHCMVDIGDAIVCFGDYVKQERVCAYQPATGKWSVLALPFTPRRHAAACVADGWVYVVGGNNRSKSDGLAVIERYSVADLREAIQRAK